MKKALFTLAALLLATTSALADDCGCKPNRDFAARAAGSASSGASWSGSGASGAAFGGRAVTTGKIAQDQKANSDSYANTTRTGAVQYSQTGAFGIGRYHSASGARGNAVSGSVGEFTVGNGADASGRAWVRSRP